MPVRKLGGEDVGIDRRVDAAPPHIHTPPAAWMSGMSGRSRKPCPLVPLASCLLRLLRSRFDHSNYLCTLLLDKNSRDSAFAVRAINVEMAQIRDATREQLAGQMRYQFWHDAIELIYAGRSSRHPVTAALMAAIERHDLPQGLFVEMLNARVDDQKRSGFGTMAELEHYCDQTASSVLLLLMQVGSLP